jgi:hypothetical protein
MRRVSVAGQRPLDHWRSPKLTRSSVDHQRTAPPEAPETDARQSRLATSHAATNSRRPGRPDPAEDRDCQRSAIPSRRMCPHQLALMFAMRSPNPQIAPSMVYR